MRFLITAACAAILTVPAMAAPDPNTGVGAALDASARKAWDEVRYDLTEIIDRLHKHKDLPDASIWHPMRNDKTSNQTRINKLMDEALSHLKIARLSEYRQTYTELGEQIAETQRLIGEHMDKMVAAPQKTGRVAGLWTWSREEHEKRIGELESKIADCKTRQQAMIEDMKQEMARMGLDVSHEQIADLLLAVSGDTFFDLSACFHNVKQLTDMVAELIKQNESYVENSRKYYGMYVSLVSLLCHAHERAQAEIKTIYLPEINRIVEEALKTRDRTQELAKRNSGDRNTLARLRQNLEAQDMVIKAGRSYTKHLEDQLIKLAKAQTQLKQHQEIALNTYETVSLASSMLNVVKKSLEDLKTIQSMDLPDMLPLESDRLRSEFQIISQQLRGE
ncbi:MAG: hypothetical protein K9N55_17230 [Phycisphaerae bacterium]|nr:hypothetical protein [Phycisphaerae bacterium]